MNVFSSLLQMCYGTNSPVWEDAFTFFIQDPRKQDIDIQVSHNDWTHQFKLAAKILHTITPKVQSELVH